MNTKSIFALLPLDIKEVISDKLCEPDKQIHKDVMEELLFYNTEMMTQRYRDEILETYNLVGDNYSESCEDWLDDCYKANKELFDDIHTEKAMCWGHAEIFKSYSFYRGLSRTHAVDLLHSIPPSYVNASTFIRYIVDSDDDDFPYYRFY